MDDLDRYRDEFPILSHTVYMISNSLGPMPRRTAQNLAEYAEIWATRGVRAWEERWWEMPAEVGNKIAWTIGAPHGTVSMHENVTTAHMVALSTIRPTASRRRLVCSAMDFPSMIHLYRAQQTSGFDLHIAAAEPDLSIATEKMLDAIDETTAPAIPAYYAALAGLDIIQEIGVARIRERSKDLTAHLLDLVDQQGFTSAASRDPERPLRSSPKRTTTRPAPRPHS